MKRKVLILGILALFALAALAGCAPAAQPGASQPTDAAPTLPAVEEPTGEPTQEAPATSAPDPSSGGADLSPAASAVVSTVSMQFGLPVEEVKVISLEEVQWPDACLGVFRPDVMCAQVITPGYRIVVEAGGNQYEYHTNLDGSSIVPAEINPPMVDLMVRTIIADSLRIQHDLVRIVSTEETEFPDSCLGVQVPGLVCAEALTPGFTYIVSINGREYEYRSDLTGSQVIAATPGLEWTRQGGIAGFDDTLWILQPGDVRAAWASQDAGAGAASLADVVSEEKLAQFQEWLEKFGEVEIVVADPATADAMTTTLTLHGSGDAQPTEEEKQAMLDFAQELFTSFNPGS